MPGTTDLSADTTAGRAIARPPLNSASRPSSRSVSTTRVDRPAALASRRGRSVGDRATYSAPLGFALSIVTVERAETLVPAAGDIVTTVPGGDTEATFTT